MIGPVRLVQWWQRDYTRTTELYFAGSFTETDQGEVTLSEIPAVVLERVCQYFYYKLRHQNACVPP